MKHIIMTIMAVLTMSLTACAQNKKTDSDMQKKVVVVYFSATGTTERVAKMIASTSDAQLIVIEPEVLYTPDDLNWRDGQSRSSVEMNDAKCRGFVRL